MGCGTPEPPQDSIVRLEIADWVPSRSLHGWWGAVTAGGAPEERVNWTNNHNGLLLSPDKYDIIWVQSNSHLERPMLLSSDIEIRQGEKVTITVNSGVILEVADWVPTRTLHGWWGAVPAGGAPEERVNWTNNHNALLLPPDKYDIVWVQSGSHRDDPLVLYPGLSIAPDEIHTLSVNSGVRLELTDNASSLRSGGWWGAVPAGDNSEETVHRTEQADQSLLLPPGIYDIVWKTRHGNDALLLHEQVTVAEGELVVVQPEFPDGMN